jgi:hypothetical protein
MDHSKSAIVAGGVLLLLLALPLTSPCDATERKKGGLADASREIGKLGREIGRAGKDAGLEIAGAAKHVFYKGRKVSAPLLRDVQHSTREFWADVVAGKDRTIEGLRRKNHELQRRLRDEEKERDE